MSPVVTLLCFRLFCPEDRYPLGRNCEIEMYIGGLELQICVNKYSICGECQATDSFLHFIFYFLPQTSLHLYYESAVAFQSLLFQSEFLKQQKWDDFANCNIILYMILSQPVTHLSSQKYHLIMVISFLISDTVWHLLRLYCLYKME